MSTLREQLKALEKEASLLDLIRGQAKSEGGKLTVFGKNFVHICVENNISNGDIAKILDVTSSAISQWATKLKKD